MLRVAFALLFTILAPLVEAQPLADAAGQLAPRISSLLPRRATVSLDFRSLTAKAPDGWSSFRAQLQAALQKAGVEMVSTATTPPDARVPDARVTITLAESAQGLLFVAEVTSAENHQVAMLPWTQPRTETKPRLTLVNRPLWEQPEPVLDLLLLNSGAQMLVLGTSSVTSYQWNGGKWTFVSAAPLALARPMPRDPRGRILSASDGFRVYVPGTSCSGSTQPSLKLTCTAGNETWNGVRWVSDRNVLESDQTRGSFYAPVVPPASGAESWGSDVAAADTSCTQGTMVIATNAGAEREQVQAYEVAGGQASVASAPLSLPGPVTAMWSSETRGQITVVVRDAQTGEYAASRLGLACAE